ncbi:MAG TPA: ADP-dependent glucokinase/phosphofructokinase [Propionibacteriaceae bacterium]|nr:ADP-dependent glucokinase/phosphofructokinase [Propionibacteriaceae bacterium]
MSHELVLGLGGCVDFEVAWDPRVLEQLAAEHGIGLEDLDAGLAVEDERSLVCSLLAFVRDGVGGERFIASSEIAIAFAARFPCRVTLGGTCVRAALALARLGVPSLVHLVSIDDNVRQLLAPGIDYISSARGDTLDPHLIVQFPAGATVAVRDGVVRADHPNRVIYVNDPPNRDLLLSPELPRALETARAFLPAGFNVMRDPGLLNDRLVFLQGAMTRLPAGAVVFYEDAGFHDNAMRVIVNRAFRGRIDVHSLNEDELQSYLGRRMDLLDVDDVVTALVEFAPQAIASTVVVHTKHWALAYGDRAGDFAAALAGGVDLASTRYRFGDGFTAADLESVRALPVQAGGARFAEQIGARLGERVRCVPGRVLDTATPTTIGLGDTFVGGFLATVVHGRLGASASVES